MKKISDRKRIVIKVGTSTLTHRTGMLNIRRVEQLVKTLADIQNSGHEVILVSSGAIGLGMGKLGLRERPKDTPGKQACAAVGQCELMYLYDNLFAEYSISVAQMLLTKYVLLEDRRKNVENAMERLISHRVIPVINENDTVAIDELELEVGENDSLAAIVADIAKAFGCEVIYYSTSGKNSNSDYRQVSFDELLLKSDIVSIHAPLNDATSKLMNESAFKKMKEDAVLLNLGRGGIIDDEALAEAIENDEIGAVGLDVLNGEPIKHDNPLNRILDRSNVYITPHIAWAAVEARKRCVEEVYKNIESFLNGEVRNSVYDI